MRSNSKSFIKLIFIINFSKYDIRYVISPVVDPISRAVVDPV